MRRTPSLTSIVAFSALLSSIGIFARSALSQTRKNQSSPNFYSLDKEKQLGYTLAQEFERSSRLVDDPVIGDYLDGLAKQLAKSSGAKFPIVVRVVDTATVDALFLPGGYQYVDRGLILITNSEAELACILAHGIAHTALRSWAVLATKNELIQLASIPAMIYVPYTWSGSSGLASSTSIANNLALPLTVLKFRRDQERAADFYAVQYLYKAGYSAESYPHFLERLSPRRSKEKNSPDPFSPFPPLAERVRAMREEITQFPQRAAETISSPDFETVKERLRNWQPKEPPTATGKPTLGKLADQP